ncbi:class I SAM-dependent methyltransferase [Actinopolymorpha alba]|uniref:class I SAM-dependent methyltransferase n=1 Tax=Actinopolymorpha alba TaxID=533267 RepID=UPI00037C4FF6|nr:class I SAM-dependent methyltransferase [Actinopolymorpha alba]
MLDYDKEVGRYDETRGGLPRAEAAAEAIASLLPPGAHTVLDVAGGTGLVASRLAERGHTVCVCDRSVGMLSVAADRIPGCAVGGDATRLPVADGRVGVVTLVWLLHLLPDAAPVIEECARVLRPGGILVTTIDKNASYAADDDVERVLATYGAPGSRPPASDARARIERLAGRWGLTAYSEGRFVGHGQGLSPTAVADAIEARSLGRRVDLTRTSELIGELRALPDPDRPRRPPTYALLAFRKDAGSARPL